MSRTKNKEAKAAEVADWPVDDEYETQPFVGGAESEPGAAQDEAEPVQPVGPNGIPIPSIGGTAPALALDGKPEGDKNESFPADFKASLEILKERERAWDTLPGSAPRSEQIAVWGALSRIRAHCAAIQQGLPACPEGLSATHQAEVRQVEKKRDLELGRKILSRRAGGK